MRNGGGIRPLSLSKEIQNVHCMPTHTMCSPRSHQAQKGNEKNVANFRIRSVPILFMCVSSFLIWRNVNNVLLSLSFQ